MEKKIIDLNGIFKRMILCRTEFPKSKRKAFVIIKPITEEEENEIDKSERITGSVSYKNGSRTINGNDIYMYGKVDLNDESDVELINKFNLIDEEGGHVYSHFDFDKGVAETVNGRLHYYTTFNPLLWFKYCYCLIGKPERIIVYKDSKINNVI